MSFHESSEDIYIKEEDGQTFLVAKCGVGDDDDPNESQICLDEIIGNSDGIIPLLTSISGRCPDSQQESSNGVVKTSPPVPKISLLTSKEMIMSPSFAPY